MKIQNNLCNLLLIIIILISVLSIPMTKSNELNEITESRSEFSTPNTGVIWTMDDLVANSSGNVTYNSNHYVVNNTIKISEKDELILKPGIIIKMKKLSCFRIYGTFIAIGKPNEYIQFTQDPVGDNWPDKFLDHWSGIKFFESCNFKKCALSYCKIEEAGDGIVTFNAPIKIENNIIRSRFYGISIYGKPAKIYNNTINCSRESIAMEYCYPSLIENCTLNSELSSCVSLFNSTVTISNSTFVTMPFNNIVLKKQSIVYFYKTNIIQNKIYFDDNSSRAFLQWKLRINVIDRNNNPISKANVVISNKSKNIVLNSSTNYEGYSDLFICSEYELKDITNDGDCLDLGEKIYHSPYHIFIKKEGYGIYERFFSIDLDKNLEIILYKYPELKKKIPNTFFLNEDNDDGNDLINLEDFFWDSTDDGNLEFEIIYKENEKILDAVVDGNFLDFKQREINWNGKLNFQIQAKNDYNLTCLSNIFFVTIKPTDDPPLINDIGGKIVINNKIEIKISQNEYFNATLNVTEVDGEIINFKSDFNLSNFQLNQNSGEINFLPSNDEVGIFNGNITVIDENNSDNTVKVILIVQNINDPPEKPLIISPTQNKKYTINDFITFNASCVDIDMFVPNSQEKLKYIWRSDKAGKLGEGKVLTYILLPEGKNTITLEVIDLMGANNSASIILNIEKNNTIIDFKTLNCILVKPKNKIIIKETNVLLTWKTNFANPKLIQYKIYIDTNPLPKKLVANNIKDTKFLLESLEDKTVYYWTVIPYIGNIKGNCTSGIYEFKIDSDHEKDNQEGQNFYIFDYYIWIISIIVFILIFTFSLLYYRNGLLKKNNAFEQPLTKKPIQIQQNLNMTQKSNQLNQPSYQQPGFLNSQTTSIIETTNQQNQISTFHRGNIHSSKTPLYPLKNENHNDRDLKNQNQ